MRQHDLVSRDHYQESNTARISAVRLYCRGNQLTKAAGSAPAALDSTVDDRPFAGRAYGEDLLEPVAVASRRHKPPLPLGKQLRGQVDPDASAVVQLRWQELELCRLARLHD